jgi:hypothetical protein
MTDSFNTPVLFIIFNRPDTTQLVFDAIRRVKPKQFFVAADGPRRDRPEDKGKCEAARKIIGQVDWDCKIRTLLRDENLGCGRAESSAMTWFFENVEEGIILEDDCLPDQSFFYYAESLLKKYKNDERVMMISGNNFQGGVKRGGGDYYFSRLPHSWGWATWRRVWKQYDFDVKDFPEFLKRKTIEKIFEKKEIQEFWLEKIEEVYTHRLDTWDYQLFEAIWKNNGLCISPNVNLISNVGFGPDATHTLVGSSVVANVPSQSLLLPLAHPSKIAVDKDADDFDAVEYMRNTKIKRFLKKIGLFDFMRYLYHKYL